MFLPPKPIPHPSLYQIREERKRKRKIEEALNPPEALNPLDPPAFETDPLELEPDLSTFEPMELDDKSPPPALKEHAVEVCVISLTLPHSVYF